jgi:hypothetical protein
MLFVGNRSIHSFVVLLLYTMHDLYASHALSDIWMRYGVIMTISFHIQQVSVSDLLNVFPAP